MINLLLTIGTVQAMFFLLNIQLLEPKKVIKGQWHKTGTTLTWESMNFAI